MCAVFPTVESWPRHGRGIDLRAASGEAIDTFRRVVVDGWMGLFELAGGLCMNMPKLLPLAMLMAHARASQSWQCLASGQRETHPATNCPCRNK